MTDNFITIDYVRFVVEMSGHTEFLEFAKDEQYYRILNAAVDYGIIDELFPNSTISYTQAINTIKRYKTFTKFQNSFIYKNYIGLKYINNLYHYIWTDEIEYIDYDNISTEQLIRILNQYKTWEVLKVRYYCIYYYIFNVLYPIPFDYNIEIQPVCAYLYMIEHNMIEYPRSIVFKNYVTFRKNLRVFSLFSSNEEMNNTKEGIEYMNKQRELSCMKKYGKKSYMNTDEFKKKSSKTIKELYNVENVSQAEEIKQKKIDTVREHFGVDFPQQLKEIHDKTIQRWKETRGVEHISQDPLIKEQKIQTNLQKRGVENPSQDETIKKKKQETLLKHFGVSNPLQSSELKEKAKRTSIQKYGVEYPTQTSIIQQKIHRTKKQNRTYAKSSDEELIYNMLLNIFNDSDVIRQYHSERYPFDCDFYIKPLDLFIEYQGFWSHNTHPYNPEFIEDQQIVKLWESKKYTNPSYANAINVWTYRDPLKRQTAKDNNLNFVELWNMDDVNKFITELKDTINK